MLSGKEVKAMSVSDKKTGKDIQQKESEGKTKNSCGCGCNLPPVKSK